MGRHRFSKAVEKDLTTLDEGRSGDCDLSSSNLLAVTDCGRARVLLTNDSSLVPASSLREEEAGTRLK